MVVSDRILAMPTKPTETLTEFCSETTYTAAISAEKVGTPTKISLGAASNFMRFGAVPGKGAPAQAHNYLYNVLSQYAIWTSEGTSDPVEEARIVEADANGVVYVPRLKVALPAGYPDAGTGNISVVAAGRRAISAGSRGFAAIYAYKDLVSPGPTVLIDREYSSVDSTDDTALHIRHGNNLGDGTGIRVEGSNISILTRGGGSGISCLHAPTSSTQSCFAASAETGATNGFVARLFGNGGAKTLVAVHSDFDFDSSKVELAPESGIPISLPRPRTTPLLSAPVNGVVLFANISNAVSRLQTRGNNTLGDGYVMTSTLPHIRGVAYSAAEQTLTSTGNVITGIAVDPCCGASTNTRFVKVSFLARLANGGSTFVRFRLLDGATVVDTAEIIIDTESQFRAYTLTFDASAGANPGPYTLQANPKPDGSSNGDLVISRVLAEIFN